MARNYDPQLIESKWQARWEKAIPQATDFAKKKKNYALVEFPYPSGAGLHVGHVFTGTILDVFARKKRMEGFNVLYPMGWDAFGLPTENYAIRTGIHPAVATKKNTDRFRKQMKKVALAYNWKREINTTDPDYYHWTQWIFVKLFKYGLAYKKKMPINWCPSCKIGLANEEVVAGKCERCGALAGRKELSQWLLRITLYADRLADELDLVDYPDYVKASQRNWIGRSKGLEEEWPVEGMNLKLKTFTTWPHTTWGATFMVIAPEHPVIEKLVKGTKYEKGAKAFCQKAIQAKIKDPSSVEKNKEGFFLGRYVINHLSNRKMPVFIANFAIFEYGTGIVKCTPTHDQRDFEFAKKYKLDFLPVIYPKEGRPLIAEKMKEAYVGEGLMMNAKQFNKMPTEKARKAIGDYTVKQGNGRWTVNYKLRDWVFSRQHYWGEPIPMIFCSACAGKGITWWETKEGKSFPKTAPNLPNFPKDRQGSPGWFPVAEEDLPVKLPEVKRYQPTDTGESPLATIKDWVKTKCPACGGPAKRETDTMPNWAGSSWYFLRYCDIENKKKFADFKKLKYWLPVDLYLGGAEHTTLHLLYSRFWHKFLFDIGMVPGKEPYAARRQHGMILAEDGRKMSKSFGNVINPEDVIDKFGADTLRVYLMFMGPYELTMPWNSKGVEGAYRFLTRVWRIYQRSDKIHGNTSDGGRLDPDRTSASGGSHDSSEVELRQKLHQLTKKVSEDIEVLKHNTAIAALMEFLNSWEKSKKSNSELKFALSKKDAGIYLKLLAPFAPHLAEELWQQLQEEHLRGEAKLKPREHLGGGTWSIHAQPWPKYDPKLVKERMVTIVVQVGGKVRGQIEVKSQESRVKSQVERAAKMEKNVAKHLKGKKIKKAIFVPGRLINFVI